MSELAVLGGRKIPGKSDETLFHWPIVDDAMIAAQTKVLTDGNMSGSDKAGWCASRFHYDREAFGGVTNVTFCEALNAEAVNSRVLGEPWFRHCYHSRIDPCIEAVHKVAAHLDELRGWEAADAG